MYHKLKLCGIVATSYYLLQYDIVYNNLMFVLWWFGLGVLSSIGLGSGLHTFVLFTGPYIAKTALEMQGSSILDILQKVFIVSFIWGAGSAVGELPPYFLSKKATEINSIHDATHDMSRAEKILLHFLKRHAFSTVLIFASIPNPLFDLAGVLCGRYRISFVKFFSATFIGKAIIKPIIQALVIIYACVMDFENHYPVIRNIMMNIKNQYAGNIVSEPVWWVAWLSTIWEFFIVIMILYFIVSIVKHVVENHKNS